MKTQMPFNNELEKLKAQIKVLEKKVALLEEIENTPIPEMTLQQEGEYAVVSYPLGFTGNDTTYYRFMNKTTFAWYIKKGVSVTHPVPTLVFVTDAETERLLEGLYYNHIEVKKETAQKRGERVHNEMEEVVRESVEWCEEHIDTDPLDWVKPQTHEQVADGLKEAFREAVKQGVVSSTKSKTLTDLIYRWWSDVFTTHSDWDMETSIEDLVDRIQLWLPKEQSAKGSQNTYVECSVDGFNDCLNKIKCNLR